MHPKTEVFLREVLNTHPDPVARLVFADWLDGLDDKLGWLLRLGYRAEQPAASYEDSEGEVLNVAVRLACDGHGQHEWCGAVDAVPHEDGLALTLESLPFRV